MVGNLEMTELCHRCRRVPMVTTVSDGAREVALCLGCLATLAQSAANKAYYSTWPQSHDEGIPQEVSRKAWREALERVGKE